MRNPTRLAKIPTGKRRDPVRGQSSEKKLKLNNDLMLKLIYLPPHSYIFLNTSLFFKNVKKLNCKSSIE